MDMYRRLNGKVVLITGATGLIGKTIIKRLLEWNKTVQNPVKIIAVVRDEEKAKNIFGECENIRFYVSDVCDIKPKNMNVDYVIHAASKTSSRSFIDEPVETIVTALEGTKNILEFARKNQVLGLVYLSSMEVYGTPTTDEKIDENHNTNLNIMSVRSCYPESKRMCENLCISYVSEYNVPIKIVRLTQTFGPGVRYDDDRVFAEFARCAIEGRDIVLNTKGETKRNYLYTEDAVDAIITVLLNGRPGEAYNAANEDTYCSIYEMACLIAEKCTDKKINVVIKEKDDYEKLGYAPTLHMNLDTSKLRALGWNANTGLVEMYNRMIADMQESRQRCKS